MSRQPIQNILNTRGIFRNFRCSIRAGNTNHRRDRRRDKFSPREVVLVEFVSWRQLRWGRSEGCYHKAKAVAYNCIVIKFQMQCSFKQTDIFHPFNQRLLHGKKVNSRMKLFFLEVVLYPEILSFSPRNHFPYVNIQHLRAFAKRILNDFALITP